MELSSTEANLGFPKGIHPDEDTRWPVIFYFYRDDIEALY